MNVDCHARKPPCFDFDFYYSPGWASCVALMDSCEVDMGFYRSKGFVEAVDGLGEGRVAACDDEQWRGWR